MSSPQKTVRKPIAKRASYADAITWIAINDGWGDNLPADELSQTISVLLVADIFDQLPMKVAVAVVVLRAQLDSLEQMKQSDRRGRPAMRTAT